MRDGRRGREEGREGGREGGRKGKFQKPAYFLLLSQDTPVRLLLQLLMLLLLILARDSQSSPISNTPEASSLYAPPLSIPPSMCSCSKTARAGGGRGGWSSALSYLLE